MDEGRLMRSSLRLSADIKRCFSSALHMLPHLIQHTFEETHYFHFTEEETETYKDEFTPETMLVISVTALSSRTFHRNGNALYLSCLIQ